MAETLARSAVAKNESRTKKKITEFDFSFIEYSVPLPKTTLPFETNSRFLM